MPSPAPELGEGSRDWPWGQALIRLYAHLVSSCLLDDIECSFEVVGDGGEVDLDGGFGETALSHPAKPVALFPGAEHLFDSALHPMDRLVSFLELLERRLFVATPHTGGDNPRYPAFCATRTALRKWLTR